MKSWYIILRIKLIKFGLYMHGLIEPSYFINLIQSFFLIKSFLESQIELSTAFSDGFCF